MLAASRCTVLYKIVPDHEMYRSQATFPRHSPTFPRCPRQNPAVASCLQRSLLNAKFLCPMSPLNTCTANITTMWPVQAYVWGFSVFGQDKRKQPQSERVCSGHMSGFWFIKTRAPMQLCLKGWTTGTCIQCNVNKYTEYNKKRV